MDEIFQMCQEMHHLLLAKVRVDGQDFPIGGTSAVALLWAGLIALINQAIGARVGFLNTLLYTRIGSSRILRDITNGIMV